MVFEFITGNLVLGLRFLFLSFWAAMMHRVIVHANYVFESLNLQIDF